MTDRYGNLGKPEEKAHIEMVENPVLAARSAYYVWRRLAQVSGISIGERWEVNEALVEQLYREAVKLLRPAARSFTNIPQRQLDTILTEVVPERQGVPGLFLSALLNETDLKVMDGTFTHHFLGYRLAPGKTLITRAGSDIDYLGTYAAGILANYGVGRYEPMAHALGSVQVNYGKVFDMARCARGGVQLNLSEHMHTLGTDARGGIQVSYLSAGDIRKSPPGGVKAYHLMFYDNYRSVGLQTVAGMLQWSFEAFYEGLSPFVLDGNKLGPERCAALAPLARRIDARLTEAGQLKNAEDDPAKILTEDWQRNALTLEADINGIKQEIERLLE